MTVASDVRPNRPRSRYALGAVFVFAAALFWTMALLGSACDNNKKLSDRHDELLRQEEE